ncbi:hypothetical protein WA026_018270 [Henosepilachna vigintioctopunctata]|uniref:Uncharacterized protein n=1 Tax=Henosepilachna vigintioctopunctata TaxID=420089 RepID=A0AAW1VG97_9CUCU
MCFSSSTCKPLTKRNYDTCAMQIEAFMVKDGTRVYVNGRKPKLQLLKNDAASIIIILLRMIKGMKTSKQIRENLKTEYAFTGPEKRAILFKRLTSYKVTENIDFHTQLMEFIDVIENLSAMGVAMNDDSKLALHFNALIPSSFDIFRCAMECQSEFPKPNKLREEVVEYNDVESQRDMDDSEVMLVKRTFKKLKPYQNYGNQEKGYQRKCYQGSGFQGSTNIVKTLKYYSLVIAHSGQNQSIKQMYTKLKNETISQRKGYTAYNIPHNSCSKCYIGQISQNLEEQIEAHKCAKIQITALHKRTITAKCYFNYNNPHTLATEKDEKCREILEMLHIHENLGYTVNERTDIKYRNAIYEDLINLTKRLVKSTHNNHQTTYLKTHYFLI